MHRGKYERVTKTNKLKWLVLILSVILASLIIVGCTLHNQNTDKDVDPTISTNIETSNDEIIETENDVSEPITEPEPVVYTATVGAMGDLLMHSPIFNGIVKQEDGSYDFASIFQYIDDNLLIAL